MAALRKATYDDIDLLYDWACDFDVRRNSFHSGPISYEDHVAWFDRMMNSGSVFQYILMDVEIPVGQIRLQVNGDEAEIGYSICKAHREKGYGHKILQLIAEEVRTNHPDIRRLVARVKPDNVASNELFRSEGYGVEYLCYALDAIRQDFST